MASTLRPWASYQRSASSSLSGMEITASNSSLRSNAFTPSTHLIGDDLFRKPLPPTPRKASSIYSVWQDEKRTPHKQSIHGEVLAPNTILKPAKYVPNTFRVSETTPSRPSLAHIQQPHAVSDPILERRRAQQEDLVDQITHSSQLLFDNSIFDSPAPASPLNNTYDKMKNEPKGANQYASNYEAVLHTRSSVLPAFTFEPYADYNHLPSPMSPRITDVVDQSLVPPPLRFSSAEDSTRPASRFSSSSESESFDNRFNDSPQSYAQKAVNWHKGSLERMERMGADLPVLVEPQYKKPQKGRRGSKISLISGQRRGSIQQSLSHVYDTLTKFSIGSPTPKPILDVATTKKARVPRELRSPAIPITPYQQMGRKAWETSSNPTKIADPSHSPYNSRLGLAGSEYFPISVKDDQKTLKHSNPAKTGNHKASSMISKIATAFQSGTSQVELAIGLRRTSVKLAKSEMRRRQLKKKIVVIGIGDPRSTEKSHGWV